MTIAIIPKVGLCEHVMRTAVAGHVTPGVTWSHEHRHVPEFAGHRLEAERRKERLGGTEHPGHAVVGAH